MDLGREGGDVGAGEDRRAHDEVVGEGHVDAPGPLGDRPDGGDVGVEVAVELRLAQLREGLDLEPLVGVLHVDRQQAADVGVVDLDPLDPHLAVLAEQVHLVAEPGQRRRQVGVVDVAAGAAQHVAVEDEDAHRVPRQAISVPGREREAALQDAGAGLRPRGAGPGRAGPGLRRPRDRRGDGAGGDGAAARPLALGPAADAGEPARLPPLRPADRARRQRLPVLRPAPAPLSEAPRVRAP